ncbi:5'-nucleotidase [Micromonospora psammae]|uniref:5'-nucleotidase n=1 Tax=Micromonospora sp. CPCC 205556 TaxID=3122398 RepID=UPI002FEF31C8
MPYDLDSRLVIGIASSALFDLEASDEVFRTQGEEAYRKYQEDNIDSPLAPGVAFPFIKRLLTLNDLSLEGEGPLVEVIILSRNDPDTGLRVMKSVEHHGLAITRAIFMQGKSPYKFMPVLHMSLFLSANPDDVIEATSRDLPAGQVLPSQYIEDDDSDLRIAFDFDGVLADDSAERVMQAGGLEKFHAHERANVVTPHSPGPLNDFLREVNRIQRREEAKRLDDPNYRIRLHVSIVTARNAPSHQRAIASLKAWGVTVNDAFFLGGIDKGAVIRVLKPHIFFDDQQTHLTSTSQAAPSVHIPFGVVNSALAEAKPTLRVEGEETA